MQNKSKSATLGAAAILALILAAFAYLYVPALAVQPGTEEDPLVTRRFVESQMAAMAEEIAALRSIVAGIDPGAVAGLPQGGAGAGISAADRAALFAEVVQHVEAMLGGQYGERTEHMPIPAPQPVLFDVLHLQAGQRVLFEAGAEFILRGGRATAITGEYNGIPNVTAGADVLNGENIGLNHLMMIPFTDGRGIHLQAESWVMVRGGYTIQ